MSAAQLELLYQLISDACTNEQIKHLLREKKVDHKDVRVSGSTTELLGHLRDAHTLGVLSTGDLSLLLARGEENGRQHIFLYRAAGTAALRYNDPRKAYAVLLKSLGGIADKLPTFVIEPKGRVLADVRLEQLTEEAFRLVVKTYSGRSVERVTDEEKFEKHGEMFIRRTIKVSRIRLVSLMRLHPEGLLEVRIPTGDRESRKTCLTELQELWKLLEAALPINHFQALDLEGAMASLVKDNGKKNVGFRISTVLARDEDASAEFSPSVEGNDLFSSQRHATALEAYEDFGKLDVYFDAPAPPAKKTHEIRCQIGVYESHGLRLGAKMSPTEADYIVNVFRRRSR